MPWASESSMPLALQMVTAQYSGPLLLSSLDLLGPDLRDRDCRVPHIFRVGFPQQGLISSGVFITWSQPMSPIVSWAELPNASSPVHLRWWSAPLNCLLSTCDGGAHCLDWPVGCSAKVVRLLVLFRRDKSFFV